jgi:anti-sigma factor RsiW
MNHEQAENLLPAYIDKELSLSEAADFEQHLNSCLECQNEYKVQSNVIGLLKNSAAYFEATPQFAKRLEASLLKELSSKKAEHGWNFDWLQAWFGNGVSKGAIIASCAALILSTSLFLATPSAQQKLTEEVTASHVRSLQADHLSDVISTDQHTVKPWFNGKLDFAPPTIDLAKMGFSIEGGRLDYINGKTVAVIVYRHNKHPINFYVWPSAGNNASVQTSIHNGYNLAHWAENGMSYWAVSDLETEKLVSFAKSINASINASI